MQADLLDGQRLRLAACLMAFARSALRPAREPLGEHLLAATILPRAHLGAWWARNAPLRCYRAQTGRDLSTCVRAFLTPSCVHEPSKNARSNMSQGDRADGSPGSNMSQGDRADGSPANVASYSRSSVPD